MVDLFHFSQNSVRQEMYDPGTHIWVKPKNISLVHFIIISGGGGGGGGRGGAISTNRYGGGGGSAGCFGVFIVPSSMLPDTIILSVGKGGAGGAGGNNSNGIAGTAGTASIIYDHKKYYTLLEVGPGGAGGALGGTAGAGAGGTGPTLAPSGQLSHLAFRCMPAANPQSGSSATLNNGTIANITPPTQQFTSGGAGGGTVNTGNTAYKGGSINAGTFPALNAEDVAIGALSTSGYNIFRPLYSTGGAGGCGFYGGAGEAAGSGGNGGFGSGGGGGGGGTLGGKGGDGGNGLIIVTSW